MEKKLSELAREDLIAPCGMDCRLCYAYIRDKNACDGCRGDDANKMVSCLTCRKKNCEKLISGGFSYCYECDSYPCASLKGLDKRYRTKYSMSMLENLASIRQVGISAFVAEQDARWTCPKCGAMLCVHKPACVSCGITWPERKYPPVNPSDKPNG